MADHTIGTGGDYATFAALTAAGWVQGDTYLVLPGSYHSDSRIAPDQADVIIRSYSDDSPARIFSQHQINGGYWLTDALAFADGSKAWTVVSGSTVYRKEMGAACYLAMEDYAPLRPRYLGSTTPSEEDIVDALEPGDYTFTDGATKYLYVRCTDDASPDAHLLTISRRDWDAEDGGLLDLAQNNVVVENLYLAGHHQANETAGLGCVSVRANGCELDGLEITECGIPLNVASCTSLSLGSSMHVHHNLAGLSIGSHVSEVDNPTISNVTVSGGVYEYNGYRPAYTGTVLAPLAQDGITVGYLSGTISALKVNGATFRHNGYDDDYIYDGLADNGYGAGLRIASDYANTTNAFRIENSLFYDNRWRGLVIGGYQTTWGGAVAVNANKFVENGTRCTKANAYCAGMSLQEIATCSAGETTIANNLFYGNSGRYSLLFAAFQVTNSTRTYIHKNNIYTGNGLNTADGATWLGEVYYTGDVRYASYVYSDYNCYYRTDGGRILTTGNGLVYYTSLATFVSAASKDAASVITNPAVNDDYTLPAASSARGTGVWVSGVRGDDDLPLPLHPDMGPWQDRTAPGRRFGVGGGVL